jgi:hypothetical protein
MDSSIIFQSASEYFSLIRNNLSTFQVQSILLPTEHFIMFFYFLCGWIVFYSFIHTLPIKNSTEKTTLDSKNRIVSIVHASLMFVLCTYDYLFHQTSECGQDNTVFQNKLMLVSCSYFTYDLMACLYFNISDSAMFFHHTLVIFSEYTGILYSSSATTMIRAMISAEISNPVMHLRSITGNYGLKHSKLYLAFEIYYFLSYTFARLIFGTYTSVYSIICPSDLIIVKISGAMIILQSVKYAFNMFYITKKRLKELKERKKAGVELFWLEYNPKLTTLEYVKKEKGEKYVP